MITHQVCRLLVSQRTSSAKLKDLRVSNISRVSYFLNRFVVSGRVDYLDGFSIPVSFVVDVEESPVLGLRTPLDSLLGYPEYSDAQSQKDAPTFSSRTTSPGKCPINLGLEDPLVIEWGLLPYDFR